MDEEKRAASYGLRFSSDDPSNPRNWSSRVRWSNYSSVIFIMRETYTPVLLQRREAANPSRESQDSTLQSRHQPFRRAILRTLQMLFLNPIVMLLSLSTALIYGHFYILITTLPMVFTTSYDFSPQILGLSGCGVYSCPFLVC